MKCVSPIAVIESENILTGSKESNYTVEENSDGSGNIIMNAFDLFN